MGVPELSNQQLQWLMMRLHVVPPEKQIAMLGRLKHLQRLKWPPGSNTGKGQRVKYKPEQVLLVALSLELIQLGMTPERAIETLREDINIIRGGIKTAQAPTWPVVVGFDPAALSDALGGLATPDHGFHSAVGGIAKAVEDWAAGPSRRVALLNLTAVINAVDNELAGMMVSKPGEFFAALREAFLHPRRKPAQ